MIKLSSQTKHLLQIALLSVFFVTITVLRFSLKPETTAYSKSITSDQTVSVYIGIPIATIFGYTCPDCEVHLTANPGTLLQTQSGKDGYFEFTRVLTTPQSTELCLSSIDARDRTSQSVCIPAPDPNLVEPIGPVLLSPTVAISKGSFLTDETVETSGQSIPDAEISVSLFRAEPTVRDTLLNLQAHIPVKPARAALLPAYTIKTDQNGNYSFNLPSNSSNKFRLFIQAIFNTSASPKSNTLTFRILNSWEYAIENLLLSLKLLLNLLRQIPLLNIIILVQLILLIYLAYRYVANRRPRRELMVMHNDIVDYSKDKSLMRTD